MQLSLITVELQPVKKRLLGQLNISNLLLVSDTQASICPLIFYPLDIKHLDINNVYLCYACKLRNNELCHGKALYGLEGADLYCTLAIFLVVMYPASLYRACKTLDVKD